MALEIYVAKTPASASRKHYRQLEVLTALQILEKVVLAISSGMFSTAKRWTLRNQRLLLFTSCGRRLTAIARCASAWYRCPWWTVLLSSRLFRLGSIECSGHSLCLAAVVCSALRGLLSIAL